MGDKLRTHYESTACRSTFSSNNLNNHFLYFCHSGGILAHSSLQRCSSLLRFVAICLCTALITAFQSGWRLDLDWAITTPYFFSFQLFCCRFAVCLGSLSCCMTQFWTDGLIFDSRILRYTEEFMVDSVTVRCPGPVAIKQAKNHHPSTSMPDFWYGAFTKHGTVH